MKTISAFLLSLFGFEIRYVVLRRSNGEWLPWDDKIATKNEARVLLLQRVYEYRWVSPPENWRIETQWVRRTSIPNGA